VQTQVQCRFGPGFRMGPTSNVIVFAETTLYPPTMPAPQLNTLLVWAGLPTDQKERYQGVLASHGASKLPFCRGHEGQWCVYGRILAATGRAVALDQEEARNGITIRFQYNPTTGTVLQTLSSPSRLLATYEIASGKPKEFQTALEAQDQFAGIVNAHTWKNTTIRLAEPDPNFGSTMSTSLAWTPEPLTTYDRGSTWTLPTVSIQQVVF